MERRSSYLSKKWSHFKLNSGGEMPAIGLGTYKILKEDDVINAVDEALSCGYRLFDTAAVYGNESYLKTAFETLLPKYDLERDDIFIVSKLNSFFEIHSKHAVKTAYTRTISKMGVDYLNLLLLQSPDTKTNTSNPKHKQLRSVAWSALTELYDDACVDAIGVSNFTVNQLEELISENHSVTPTVNQVEWHPIHHDDSLFTYCRQNDIVVQGHSPFGGFKKRNLVLHNPAVKAIATDLDVQPAQVLLTWSLQKDVAVVSKSIKPERIRTNFQLNFQLNRKQMNTLDKISTNNVRDSHKKLSTSYFRGPMRCEH